MNSSVRTEATSGIAPFSRDACASLNETSLTLSEKVENAFSFVETSGCGSGGSGFCGGAGSSGSASRFSNFSVTTAAFASATFAPSPSFAAASEGSLIAASSSNRSAFGEADAPGAGMARLMPRSWETASSSPRAFSFFGCGFATNEDVTTFWNSLPFASTPVV